MKRASICTRGMNTVAAAFAASLRSLRRRAVHGVPLILALAGCIEVVPQHVETRIVIERDGRIEVSHSGTFRDLADLVAVSDPGEADAAKVSEQALRALSDSPDVAEVREMAPHLFFARWHLKAHLDEDGLPWLMGGGGNSRVPMPLKFRRLSGIDKGFASEADSLEEDLAALKKKITADRTPKGRAMAKLIGAFKATVSIEIDDDLVGFSDASSRRRVGPGRSEHRWKLRAEKYKAPRFAFGWGDVDQADLKLQSAPDGSDCKALIGDLCKCGPFILKADDKSLRTAFVPYEVTAGEITFRGCSDAKGEIPAVMAQRTGGCYLKLLPPGQPLAPEAVSGKANPNRGAACPAN